MGGGVHISRVWMGGVVVWWCGVVALYDGASYLGVSGYLRVIVLKRETETTLLRASQASDCGRPIFEDLRESCDTLVEEDFRARTPWATHVFVCLEVKRDSFVIEVCMICIRDAHAGA